MGHLYKQAESYLDLLETTSNSVFVEIGSDKGNGSTLPLAGMAQTLGLRLITVDIEQQVMDKLRYRYSDDPRLDNIDCVCAQGSRWAQEIFPTYNLAISCLYLDNFDWNYNDPRWQHLIVDQLADYANKGYEMTNFNSQLEHLAQMLALLPLMNPSSIVICDDTYTWNNCWVGKCSAVVPLLQLNGYKIIEKDDSAVMLARNFKG